MSSILNLIYMNKIDEISKKSYIELTQFTKTGTYLIHSLISNNNIIFEIILKKIPDKILAKHLNKNDKYNNNIIDYAFYKYKFDSSYLELLFDKLNKSNLKLKYLSYLEILCKNENVDIFIRYLNKLNKKKLHISDYRYYICIICKTTYISSYIILNALLLQMKTYDRLKSGDMILSPLYIACTNQSLNSFKLVELLLTFFTREDEDYLYDILNTITESDKSYYFAYTHGGYEIIKNNKKLIKEYIETFEYLLK